MMQDISVPLAARLELNRTSKTHLTVGRRMVKPHGSERLTARIVADRSQRRKLASEAQMLPALNVSSTAASNAVMLAAGYFSPLTGFHDYANALEIAHHMRTMEGLLWPIPCLNLVHDATGLSVGKPVALRDPNVAGEPVLAIQHVAAVQTLSTAQLQEITEPIFGTLDRGHPGVSTFLGQGSVLVSGPVDVLNYSYFETEFPATFRTAVEIREEIERRGWQRVVAFQTRNPMHRAHEELCKLAQAAVDADGILIHMLLGKLKPGDIPADVRDAAIRKMVELYFPDNTVIVAGYGFDMFYAGPREAILHAIFRQNAGCTHLIVGRDHAGVADYYGPFDAQAVFTQAVAPGALEIKIFEADHTAYSKKLKRVVMMRDAPDHSPDDFVLLSGTRVREMLASGEALPPEFARPEVADILMRYYRETSDAP